LALLLPIRLSVLEHFFASNPQAQHFCLPKQVFIEVAFNNQILTSDLDPQITNSPPLMGPDELRLNRASDDFRAHMIFDRLDET
jgi:hypothetical protein